MRFACSNLGYTFGSGSQRVSALDGVNLETKDGEFLAIVGPSGCGKTTLLRLLSGLLKPSAGTLERSSPKDSARALLVFQEHALFPWMNVLENASFGLEMQGSPRAERRRAALELLERYGLGGREKAYPNQLSAGMKQRVAVIRAFLSRPSALLMDEPFAALDYQTRLVLQGELLELWEQRRTSVVFVTHDIDEALLLSDRVVLLSRGPGKIVGEFPVRLPRPRRAQTGLSAEFLQLKGEILGRLGL
jgi:ABC-type nitrate/sulfonate/bicarbonate transport system ATPase subunit